MIFSLIPAVANKRQLKRSRGGKKKKEHERWMPSMLEGTENNDNNAAHAAAAGHGEIRRTRTKRSRAFSSEAVFLAPESIFLATLARSLVNES